MTITTHVAEKLTAEEVSSSSYPAPQRPTIQELKNKYESNIYAACYITKITEQLSSPRMSKKFTVKEMASMFNSGISKIIKSELDDGKYSIVQQAEPLPVSKTGLNKEKALLPKSNDETEPKSMFFESEDNFLKLTVKEKAQLYTQFVNDMYKTNPICVKHAESIEISVKKEVVKGEVVHEKQQSVKNLLKELEARSVFPRQTVSPWALKRNYSAKEGSRKSIIIAKVLVKSEEFEDIFENNLSHTSTLTVTLQPARRKKRTMSLPRYKVDDDEIFKELSAIEPCHKRNNDQMSSSLPIEVYAPPKKIRRTGAERLSTKIFYQNPQLENLFFYWLNEKRLKKQESTVETISEEEQLIDHLLEQTMAKIENLQFDRIAIHAKSKLPSRKKTPAPPIQKNKANANSSTNSLVKPLTSEESESGLSSLPKIASDESPADAYEKESDNSEKDGDFAEPIKPPRKKKLRRILTWKKDTSLAESHRISSTDSDSDYKNAETKDRNKMIQEQIQTIEVNNAAIAELTASENPCQEGNSTDDLDAAGTQFDDDIHNRISSSDLNGLMSSIESKSFTDSCIDQGFETGSNEMNSPIRGPKSSNFKRENAVKALTRCPLFVKLDPESQPEKNETGKPQSFSTPIRGRLEEQPVHLDSRSNHQPVPLKSRRKSLYDTEYARNSSAMQVIREHQPLEHHKKTSSHKLNTKERVSFSTPPTEPEMPTDLTERTSKFWIKCGEFSVSLDIFYNDPDRVRLLYEIFCQKSYDNKELHFGIDNQKFSMDHLYDQQNISKRLPDSRECSHYWFATGDLAIPFSGKILTADKITRIFGFIKAAVEESGILRFGVDAVEFSNVCEFWNQSPKLSMDSSYSMLVGLQSSNNNSLEGRSQFGWPHSKPVRVSDLDQSDNECDDFEESDSYRLSFSPFNMDLAALGSEELSLPRNMPAIMASEIFDVEYENKSLDDLFDEIENNKGMLPISDQQSPVPQILNILKNQQKRLSLMYEKLSRYNKSANISNDALDDLNKETRQYLKKLQRDDANTTSSTFRGCTVQQLENYMFILCRYADIWVHSCSDQMEKLLETLLVQGAAAL